MVHSVTVKGRLRLEIYDVKFPYATFDVFWKTQTRDDFFPNLGALQTYITAGTDIHLRFYIREVSKISWIEV